MSYTQKIYNYQTSPVICHNQDIGRLIFNSHGYILRDPTIPSTVSFGNSTKPEYPMYLKIE